MPEVTPLLARLRGQIASRGHRARELADILQIHETALSAILNGRRPMPEGFEPDVYEALDLLDRAEEARQRVLAGKEKPETE